MCGGCGSFAWGGVRSDSACQQLQRHRSIHLQGLKRLRKNAFRDHPENHGKRPDSHIFTAMKDPPRHGILRMIDPTGFSAASLSPFLPAFSPFPSAYGLLPPFSDLMPDLSPATSPRCLSTCTLPAISAANELI